MNAAMNNALIEKLIKLEVYLAELIELVYAALLKQLSTIGNISS